MPQTSLIPPHGGTPHGGTPHVGTPHVGTLVNRLTTRSQSDDLKKEAAHLPRITLSTKQACDLEMIGMGAFSPLTGFLKKDEFRSVCEDMTLADGTVFPIPITLAVDDDTKATLTEGERAALYHSDGTLLAVIDVDEVYPHDKKLEIPNVFGTEDQAHPGAKAVMDEGDWLVGGPVHVVTNLPEKEPGEQFTDYRLKPAQTRKLFESKGWRTVAAFQTRNPIHRAHEYLTKCALEITDGLMIHPLVGQTKEGDIPAEVRMQCYRTIIDNYYVKERTVLAVMPAAMRYAGPREAVLHALIRQNYGVSHFIVGRDHAGVGDYYGTYQAQELFDQLPGDGLAITPLKFEHASWCNVCEGMTSGKTCPHPGSEKIFLSGTKVRGLLKEGKRPPQEFSRPEVADVLLRWAQGE